MSGHARSRGISRRAFLERAGATGMLVGTGGLLAACGGGSSGSSEIAAGSITFIKGPNHADDLKFQKDFASSFMSDHPKITVQPRLYDWGTVETQLTTAFASPNPPDIIYMADTLWPKYAAAGSLLDLSDRVGDASYKADHAAYPEKTWNSLVLDGRTYGVPWFIGVLGLQSVNLDLMKKAGVTDWNSSYEAMREAAKRTTGGNHFGWGMASAHSDFAYQNWLSYVHNAGADIFAADGKSGGLNTPDVAAAFDVLRGIQYDDGSAPRAGLYDRVALKALFVAGRIGILTDDPPVHEAEAGKIKFDWDMYVPPPGPAGQTSMGGIGSLFISSKSKAPEAAWEYVKYLSSPSIAAKWFREIGEGAPARTGLADKAFTPSQTLQKKIYGFVPKVQAPQSNPKEIDAIQAVNDQYEALVRGRLTGAEFAKKANDAVTTLAQGA